MCYWMMEKRYGAAKSTEGKMTASGKTEKVTPADGAVTARRQSEEKAYSDFKGHIQTPAVKEREEETIS